MRLPIEPELKRAIELNLQRLASGAVQREKEKLADERKEQRVLLKKDKKLLVKLTKHLLAVEVERDGLQAYLDELLSTPGDMNPLGYAEGGSEQQYFGLIEETDHAVEGCNNEIVDLDQQIAELQRRIG